jgi:hypothetical protein
VWLNLDPGWALAPALVEAWYVSVARCGVAGSTGTATHHSSVADMLCCKSPRGCRVLASSSTCTLCVRRMFICMQRRFAEGLTTGLCARRVPGAAMRSTGADRPHIGAVSKQRRPCATTPANKLTCPAPLASNCMQSIPPAHAECEASDQSAPRD